MSAMQKILRFPLTRLVLALGMLAAGSFVASTLVGLLADAIALGERSAGRALLAMTVLVPAVYLSYRAYVRVIERRALTELSGSGSLRELTLGVLLGASLFAAVIGAIAIFGSYRSVGSNPLSAILPILFLSVLAGFAEEVVARGIIFRILEDGLGTWTALVLSAALFGILHHLNPNATWRSSTSIALTAGLLLGATFVFTRRLWLAIGLHFSWNFTQGGIFGVSVSGHEVDGLLRSELGGPELISGGAFGAEASIFSILVCVPVAIYFLAIGRRRGRFLRPMWRRGASIDLRQNTSR